MREFANLSLLTESTEHSGRVEDEKMEGGAEGEACFMGVMESNERGGGRNSATEEDRNRGAIAKRADCRRLICRKEGEGGNNRSEGKFVITESSTLHSRREARENSYLISLPRLLHQWEAE